MKKIGIFLLFLSGCYANPIVPLTAPKAVITSSPEIGVIQTQEIGARIAAIRSQNMQLVLDVQDPTTFGKKEYDTTFWICGLTVAPGRAKQRGTYDKEQVGKTISADCFGPLIASSTEPDGMPSGNCRGETVMIDVCRNNEDKSFFMVYPDSPTGKVEVPLLQDFDNLEVHETISDGLSSILADVIFDGLDNGSLRFAYNKYSLGSAQPITSQNFVFNASATSIIDIMEFSIEVIDITDAALTYRLIRTSKTN